MNPKILEVKNLEVSFDTYIGEIQAIRDVSFDVYQGETLTIVGESGSGKSVTSNSIMRLNPEPPARYKGGQIIFEGSDISKLPENKMEKIRGNKISMIFQDPMTSLNPTMKVGDQIMESLLVHNKDISREEAKKRTIEMLGLVHIPYPEQRFDQYPHEFSGGMRQRVMIASALICNPRLLIADEPTTALDVTVQAEIMELLMYLQKEKSISIILITHDLGVVADIANRVLVMYGGKVVEIGEANDIFYRSRHPYTAALLESVPRLDIDKKKAKLASIEGTPPDLFRPPKGCPFTARCPFAMKICIDEMPPEFHIREGHAAACWLNHENAPQFDIREAMSNRGEGRKN